MAVENFTFLVIGEENKSRLNSFVYELNDNSNSFAWVDITEKLASKFGINIKKDKKENVFKILDLNNINYNILKDSEQKHPGRSEGDINVLLNEKGKIIAIYEFKIFELYSNYEIADDEYTFLNLDNQTANNISKESINFMNMRGFDINYHLRKYDLYHKTKNILKTDDIKKIKDHLIEKYSINFMFSDVLDIYELPFIDFCLYASVYNFLPDFYFNQDGKIKLIYNRNMKIMMENIKVFVKDIEKSDPKNIITMYKYKE